MLQLSPSAPLVEPSPLVEPVSWHLGPTVASPPHSPTQSYVFLPPLTPSQSVVVDAVGCWTTTFTSKGAGGLGAGVGVGVGTGGSSVSLHVLSAPAAAGGEAR